MVIYDLYIEQGSSFSQAINLTGDYTDNIIEAKMLDSVGELHTLTVAWTDDVNGEFEISATPAQTALFSSGVGKYDIEITDAYSRTIKPIKGRVYVDMEVTI